jgi:hypothetical protein
MRKIDRTVIGSEWRRWHPVDPFEMKRHGLAQVAAMHRSGRARFLKPTTKVVNGTFEANAANSPCFGRHAAPIAGFRKEF